MLFINIVLNICLITKLNIYGAALSTTSAYAIFFIISVYVNKKKNL
ncbi:polysaccharide biosynthesis C-terminal domain-containing protein [Clostridium chauvoei]